MTADRKNKRVIISFYYLLEQSIAISSIGSLHFCYYYEENKDNFQQQGENTSFEDVKPRLEQMLVQQKQSQQISQYLQELREEATIEYS